MFADSSVADAWSAEAKGARVQKEKEGQGEKWAREKRKKYLRPRGGGGGPSDSLGALARASVAGQLLLLSDVVAPDDRPLGLVDRGQVRAAREPGDSSHRVPVEKIHSRPVIQRGRYDKLAHYILRSRFFFSFGSSPPWPGRGETCLLAT